MKLYLSSYRIPETKSLQDLLEKPLDETTVALIPNAKDYYSELAWKYKVQSYVDYFQNFGMTVNVVDLREYDNSEPLSNELRKSDLIWAAGGNTFCLRYEMKRSGFEGCIRELLTEGKVAGLDQPGGEDVNAQGKVSLNGARLYILVRADEFLKNRRLTITFPAGVTVNASHLAVKERGMATS